MGIFYLEQVPEKLFLMFIIIKKVTRLLRECMVLIRILVFFKNITSRKYFFDCGIYLTTIPLGFILIWYVIPGRFGIPEGLFLIDKIKLLFWFILFAIAKCYHDYLLLEKCSKKDNEVPSESKRH
ncbi:MAG: hypothetical protein A4E56_00397 [Pelotomaculum sp. PtaU1.Bin065]|nr:MAG: hypothetical protein A4E56_00397 [Pelotomaculum sp. PtaU1.Bin065]